VGKRFRRDGGAVADNEDGAENLVGHGSVPLLD
jgi:hypothetical protein